MRIPATTTLLLLAILFGLGPAAASPEATGASPWERSTAEEQGIDSRDLLAILRMISDDELPIHSLLILRNHHLLVEAYIHPYNENTLHNTASVTKSFMSALTGIALREKLIESVDQPVQELLPQSFPAEASPIEISHPGMGRQYPRGCDRPGQPPSLDRCRNAGRDVGR